MTATVERAATTGAPLLLPERPPRFGPISRRLLARLVAGLLAVQLIGALLIFVVDSPWSIAAGTSLVFPGAGFLYVAWPLLFALTLLALVVALVLWWGASAHLAIPLVWLASAVGAALLADGPRLVVDDGTTWGWVVPLAYVLAAATVATALVRFERAYRAKRALIPDLNAYLAAAPAPPRPVDVFASSRSPIWESSPASSARWMPSPSGSPARSATCSPSGFARRTSWRYRSCHSRTRR